MVESSDDPPLLDRIHARLHVFGQRSRNAEQPPILPLSSEFTGEHVTPSEKSHAGPSLHSGSASSSHQTTGNSGVDVEKATLPSQYPSLTPQSRHGEATPTIEPAKEKKRSMAVRFFETAKGILTYSILNVLLVFVPIGIAVANAGLNPIIVFALNAVALIPLAGLLAHATEAVAASLGDTIGALLNVTFGNAVEFIVMIIAVTHNEIRIVQASIVGSILSNLLLILGMAFALGGLKYREQIYNSTVTQMSACLLSLSVTSLLLPTAFHASFSNDDLADSRVLELSRASSIILLIIYVLYLVFQLKSHSYMYASTPQHVIDEESHPGVLANMLNSSSSSESSNSSDSDSDSSAGSRRTSRKIKNALRAARKRRKSSASSKESPSVPSTAKSQSFVDVPALVSPSSDGPEPQLGVIASGDEADADDERHSKRSPKVRGTQARDFEIENPPTKSRRSRKRSKRSAEKAKDNSDRTSTAAHSESQATIQQPQVSFVSSQDRAPDAPESSKRPLNLRSLSTARSRFIGATVFSESNPTGFSTTAPAGTSVPRAPYGLRRTSSLPDRLNRPRSRPNVHQHADESLNLVEDGQDPTNEDGAKKQMSRTSAILCLIVSTALVALCAEYMVDSIDYLVERTPLSQVFIGLIILPVVGNAAEHVTAVKVAVKNKMDLAIGVAVGSSIQIALFVTPLVVIIAWGLGKEMSLFFSLFETICLFVSAFLINFLILDGRSNYLEGCLLIAAYIIIAVAAWFYPREDQQSEIGGSTAPEVAGDARKLLARALTMATGLPLE